MLSRKYLKFQELVENHTVIRLRPKFPPEETLHGIPLAATERLVLLQEVQEFHLDGYTVVPMTNVLALRSGRAEQTIQRILTAEGVYQRAGMPYELVLDDFSALFRSLKKLGKCAIVELLPEDVRDAPAGFFIGSVVGMSNRSVALRHFDALGRWASEPSIVPYDMIKWVTFDTEYINVFTKYLQ